MKRNHRFSGGIGLVCPRCDGTNLRAYYTRKRPGGIHRVRTCRTCGKKIATVETVSA